MAKPRGGFTSSLDDPVFEGFRLDLAEIIYGNEEIGKGTYGKVYKVTFRGSVRVAKELHPNFKVKGKNDKIKIKTVKEFRRCAHLHNHSNIVELFGICENKMIQPNVIMLIMEKMDCSLNSLLESGSEISNTTKPSILLDVSSGLKYLHSQDPPIVHCCLSSNNILLTAEKRAKISDIGLAQLVVCGPEGNHITSLKARPFMAPELTTPKYGPPADVFSYGVVMLHTVTCKLPTLVPSANKAERPQWDYKSLIDQITTDAFFKILKNCIVTCLDDDPKNRPQISHASVMIEMAMHTVSVATESERVVTTHNDDVSKVAIVNEQV